MPVLINLTTAEHGGTSLACGTHESCGVDCNCGCPYTGMVEKGRVELIAEAVTTMEFSGSAEDIARICHAHPTLAEAVKEAALAVDGRAIHF